LSQLTKNYINANEIKGSLIFSNKGDSPCSECLIIFSKLICLDGTYPELR